jgi:hypothetical protein
LSVKRLKLRLFLEGIEVPVVAAQVTGGDGQPASAVIQIIATDDVHNLKPCTLVHLLFLDLYPDPEVTDALLAADSAGYAGISDEAQAALANGYRLLFSGEYIQYSLQRSPSGRSVSLQCLDFSIYWDRAKQYYMSGGTEEGSAQSKLAKAAAFMGAGTVSVGLANEDSGSATGSLVSLLTSKSSAFPGADGALGGVIRLLESIGGVYRGNNKFHGLNDVFSAAELRLRLSQMLGVPYGDTTTAALLNHKTFKSWLRATLSRNRGTVTFRQIMELVLGRCYHTHASVLAPPFRPGRKGRLKFRVPTRKGKSKNKSEAVERRKAELQSFMDAVDAPASDGGVSPLYEARRKAYEDTSNQTGDLMTIDEEEKSDPQGDVGMGSGTEREFREAITGWGLSGTGDATKERALAQKAYDYYNSKGRASGYREVEKDVFYSDRLIMTAILPNLYFCAPPRCNVFFPDIYSSFSYSRGFLEEVTRLEISSQKEVKLDTISTDPSTSTKYWAPNIAAASGDLASAARKGARVVMPHERFTGIIPSFESVPDITAFQKMDAASGRGKIPYMQRVAAFNFFEKRFAPRSASVDGPFNPYIIAALPALIIDQVTPDSVRKTLNITPTQYLGKISSISHSISQGGGTTSVQLSHCRTHDERLEYLGPFINSFWEIVGQKKFELTMDSVSGALRDLSGADVGNVKSYTQNMNLYPGTSPDLEDSKIEFTSGGKVTSTATIVRSTAVTAEQQSLVAGQSSDAVANDTVVIEAVKNFYTKRSEEVSVEDGLYPPWLSPMYTNARIGTEYYQDLYQIGSICDNATPPVPNAAAGIADIPLPPGGVLRGTDKTSAELGALASRAAEARKAGREDEARELTSQASGPTITSAVDALVSEYKQMKESGGDFSDFYKAYSWRPVATMRQVLGAHDFDLSALPLTTPLYAGSLQPPPAATTGTGVSALLSKAANALTAVNVGGAVATGSKAEGFHSRAFGPYSKMEYLNHPVTAFPGAVEARKVDPAADPRGERHAAVMAYAAVLKADRGLRG